MTTSIFDSRVYRPTAGFMDAPVTWNLDGCQLAIVGMPFDCGIHPTRIGSRLGPASIREQSGLVRPYHPPLDDTNPLNELGVIDCGDALVTPGRPEPSFEVMEEAVWRIAREGVATLTMGGDGLVTLPQGRAWHRVHDDLCVIHVDAPSALLKQRLAGRRREPADEQEERLHRAMPVEGNDVESLVNDGPVDHAVDAMVRILRRS